MSADESLGSHQINSFAALLEENLQTSSESSKVQRPQLKKMADGKRPQKGGKRKEEQTAFEIPEHLYAGYCTPDEETHGKETDKQRKTRLQKIKRYWSYEWREYRYVTPKYMKEFAVKPPLKRPPPIQGQEVDPTSIRRGEEFPDEWAKHQAKLQKQAQKAVEEFNRASKASTEAGGSGSGSAPKKAMQKKPAHKPKPSAPMPSAPKVSMTKFSASKSSAPSASATAKSSVPPPAKSSSVAAAKASTPVVLASCQRTTGMDTATIAAPSASASGHTSTNVPTLKIKATAGRGTRPSPKKKVPIPQADEHDMADEDELAEFVRKRAEEVAIAKKSSVPLLLDPKKILDFIDIWCKKPDTSLDDLDLPPGPSHVLTAFILNEKHKIEQAKLVRKQQLQKQKELQKNMLTISPQQLVSMQAEIQQLSEEYERQANHCCGVRDRFINATKQVVDRTLQERGCQSWSCASIKFFSSCHKLLRPVRHILKNLPEQPRMLRLKKVPG